ncbi:DUF1799 domain-containing protein [Pseudoduganella albidiflava]|uniref:Uncharacterized protein n=1 Tax=Pseudoduganella albidiflava TaxID=321983 RepID=A0AA88C9B6_9BURK|nr:DUF1799 domain-containing protein [Pseudoduganella albidiflava]GGY68072.1 hypothetical protein GCM10007387_57820 [Pseudoduganella albidiflava]
MDPLYLWPEHVEVWSLFHRCGTQWLFAEGVRTGLNYPGVEVMLRYTVERHARKQMLIDLQVMERAALSAWEERRQKNG